MLHFGKHARKRLDEIPHDYLVWLVGQPWLAYRTRRQVENELERRQDEVRQRTREMMGPAELPKSYPRMIDGIRLDEIQSGLLAAAIAAGELVITPDIPIDSPVLRVWEIWCILHDKPHRVREIPWQEATG